MQASPSPGPAGPGASPSPAPAAAAASLWTRHTSPDGRPYWSHPQKGSVWEKPSELKSRVELEMEKTPWKEYETGGRKYWVHNLSKETTWSMPKEISGQSASTVPECFSTRLTLSRADIVARFR